MGFVALAAFQKRCQLTEFILGVAPLAGIPTAAPVEEYAVDRLRLSRQRSDQCSRDSAIVVSAINSKPPKQGVRERLVETAAPRRKCFGECRRVGDQRQAARKLREVPMDRLRLSTEGIEAVMVKISGGEVGVY